MKPLFFLFALGFTLGSTAMMSPALGLALTIFSLMAIFFMVHRS